MVKSSSSIWHNSNQYTVEGACDHCGKILQHELWCIALNPFVQYAYEIILDPHKLTIGDAIILHSLGVSWVPATPCAWSLVRGK
jgi:hypothetical protein